MKLPSLFRRLFADVSASTPGSATPETRGPVMDRLESRRLLAADDTVFDPFEIKVNFQPETATTVPPFFRADIGRQYGRRANGLTYGWAASNESNMVDRNSPRSVTLGEQYDIFAYTDGKAWSIEVPDGYYNVTLVAGEPEAYDAYYKFVVETTPVMRAIPGDVYRWTEGQDVVRVTDGKLTVEEYDRPESSRLTFLMIQRVEPPVTPIDAPDLTFEFESTTPFSRIESSVVREGTMIYVAGGFDNAYEHATNRMDVYDTVNKTWTRLADLPGSQSHFAFFSDGRFFYKIGGQLGVSPADRSFDVSADSWRYDPQSNTWKDWIDIPEGRLYPQAVHNDNKVYVVSGNTENGYAVTRQHWMLDYKNVEAGWQEVAPIPRGGDHGSSVVIETDDGPRWYVVGGEHGHGYSYVQHKDVFAYDFATDTWERRASLPEASSHIGGSLFVYNDLIWVLGSLRNANGRGNNVWSYDPRTDAWSENGVMPTGRLGGVAWAYDNKLHYALGDVFGGPRNDIIVAELR